MQPLSIYRCNSRATEHAEEWQSIFAEVMAYREDVSPTLSTETRKSTSKMPFEAKEEQRQCFVPENVRVSMTCILNSYVNATYCCFGVA